MSTTADVSVIIVNFNSGGLLRKCLACLSAQTVQPRRVVVVDNDSRDGSAACLADHPAAMLVQMGHNAGFAAACNAGIAAGGTRYVAILNPDAFPEPEWLAALLEAAQRYPDAAAFGSRQLQSADPGVLDGTGDTYLMSGRVWRARHGQPQTEADLEPREIFSACAAAALYRRAAVEGVGGFDSNFFCYVEDVDLGFRLRLAGFRARYVPDAVVEHVVGASTGGEISDFGVLHGHRNLVWTFTKNMPGALFWPLLPLHVALNLATIIVFVLRGRAGVILRAKRQAIAGLPRVWQQRRVIQRTRRAATRDIWHVLDKRLLPFKGSS